MMKELKKECDRVNNFSTTENGAVGLKSTGKELLDLNFRLPQLRGGLSNTDIHQFETALFTDFEHAVKWLFFVRDFRGDSGVGERDTFIKLYKVFFEQFPKEASELIHLISEYGRWSDVITLGFSGNNELQKVCFKEIEKQLKEDINNFQNGKSISLLTKWIPSINSTQKARKKANEICNFLEMTHASYRKMLSKLRAYLDVTEVKTCGNRWDEIDYNKVSSNANLRYSNSFIKHDETRRREYLAELMKPNSSVKMNAKVLNPHEIWAKYTKNYCGWGSHKVTQDDSLEAMWQNLKDMGECGKTLCVVDGSGSMMCSIPNSSTRAIDVSRSLGVYFAERCEGEFHNKMIEFSSNPQFIDIDGFDTLAKKIEHVQQYQDCSNTDIEKVFMLILSTAVKNHMPQSDMPDRILIVSDMEFDAATYQFGGHSQDMSTLFDTIQNKYEEAGFKMPKLVFWNVNSRTNTIPLTENEYGVALISGFSVNLLKMVMSNQTDPWLVLKETLDSERYAPIGEILNKCKNGEI